MFLGPISAFTLSPMRGINGPRSPFVYSTNLSSSSSGLNYAFSSSSSSCLSFWEGRSRKFMVSVSNEMVDMPLAGVVFQPFEEVKKEALIVPMSPHVSLARQSFSEQCEANVRGGKVKLLSIIMPPSEFEHREKGDALYAMELALSLEKLTNEKLLGLQSVADDNNDPQMAEFIQSEFLTEQVEAIKKIAEYVVQLRMVGKGHGLWHFDQMLLHEGDAAI